MCHRRGEWSRTSERATESDAERERERTSWGARAKHRLATLLSVEGDDTADPTPAGGTAESDPETPTPEPSEDAEDEREEEPIPADD